VIRPEQTWLLSENGPNTVRIICTDGRKHPAAEDLWATYTGNNVGRWEKDTRPQITRITNLLAGRRA